MVDEGQKPVRPPDPAGGLIEAFPIVGVGASAGGLEALRRLLEAMPAEPGVALVVVQHLDPTRKSLAVEMLSRYTKLPVCQVEDESATGARGTRVEPNRVYVIPPGKYLSIAAGELHLSEPDQPRGARMAIDVFLRSLAAGPTHCPVAVILSGTGTDGTLGIKAVKAAGGLVLAQDPATAEHPGMPQSAIATGAVDHILPPEEMPEVLARFARHPFVRDGAVLPAAEEVAEGSEPPPDGLSAILAVLQVHARQDFRSYKEKTLVRRTRRRMCLLHLDDYERYAQYLREHPDEIPALARDLLISVTDFFRDPPAWEELRRLVLAPLVERKASDAPIRVWTPGCATGEESYSVAMLLLEELQRVGKACPLQVFGSDIDKGAIDYARAGRYPRSIEADVSSGRLRRFFLAQDGDDYYRVNKPLREAVLFAEQNLLADPPFSKLDLVCCRNLLIYLKPDVQEKVIALFHFALADGGVLFLGSAETVGRQTDLFETLDKRWRIFRRVGSTRRDRINLPITQHEPRAVAVPPAARSLLAPNLAEVAQNFLLRRFALACVVINRNGEVLHFVGPTEDYLVQPPGPPTRDLPSLARQGLESKLRVVVQRAIRENASQSIRDVMMQHGGVTRRVNIDVEPLNVSKQTEGLLLVAFQEQPLPEGETLAEARERVQTADTDLLHQLEQELETTREDLERTIASQATVNEELKASNEEITSMNEELQSANEELESSKEELQSLNEELSTVNIQLAGKVEEVETKHADLENLIAVTHVPTVCLDTDLAVRWFTPAMQQLIRLKPADRGRPLADFAHDFLEGDLVAVARRVLSELSPVVDEVACQGGRTFLRRVTPYQTAEHRIGGVVITFWDITQRKRDEQALRQLNENLEQRVAERTQDVRRLATSVASAHDAIYTRALDGTIDAWNAGAERLYGYTAAEAVGRSFLMLVPPDCRGDLDDQHARLRRGEPVEPFETRRVRKDGRQVLVSVAFSPVKDARGEVVGIASIGRDVTERKRIETELREALQRMDAVVETAPSLIVVTDREGRIVHFNRACEELTGYGRAEVLGQTVLDRFVPAGWRDVVQRRFADLAAPELKEPHENLWRTKSGEERLIEWRCIALPQVREGGAWALLGIGIDVTERRKTERALSQLVRQQAAVAALGQKALVERDLPALMDEAVRTVAAGLGVEYCKLLELQPGGLDLLLRAGVGWREGLVGHATVDTGRESQAGYTLLCTEPVVVDDLAAETRFRPPPLLRDHSVASGMSCRITGPGGRPFGVLGAHTTRPRRFTPEEVHFLESVANLLGSILQRGHFEEGLRESDARLRAVVDTAADAILTIDERGVIETANPAAVRMFGYPEAELIGQNVKLLMPSPYRDEHDGYLARFLTTGEKHIIGVGREVEGRRKDGSVFPVDLAVSEVEPRKRFTGILRDITRRKELEREVVEIASLEQRRIGQDLHDSVSQELTALGVSVADLAEILRTDPANASLLVRRIAQGLRRAQEKLRTVLRGLLPVAVDGEGLMAALADMTDRVQREGRIACTFDCPEPVAVADNLVATHLYLIAQEAVHNAAKHARARTVRITLRRTDRALVLVVEDDGIGLPTPVPEFQGLGLRIMRNRAAILLARLSIEPAQPTGTRVTCVLPRRNHEREEGNQSGPGPDR